MRPHALWLAMVVAALAPEVTRAQHDETQAAVTLPAAHLAQCAQVQPAVDSIFTAATTRLESARRSNDPVEMRSAVEHLQGALRGLRTQLAPCAAAGTAADPHAGHAVPSPTAAPKDTAPKPPVAADAHAGHKTMPAAKPGPTTQKPKPPSVPHGGRDAAPKKVTPSKTPKPSPTDPHAGHQPAAPEKPTDKQMDPVTGLKVDPETAPKTTYQGQTYYFSSEASKKEFLENPAKFARKPKR